MFQIRNMSFKISESNYSTVTTILVQNIVDSTNKMCIDLKRLLNEENSGRCHLFPKASTQPTEGDKMEDAIIKAIGVAMNHPTRVTSTANLPEGKDAARLRIAMGRRVMMTINSPVGRSSRIATSPGAKQPQEASFAISSRSSQVTLTQIMRHQGIIGDELITSIDMQGIGEVPSTDSGRQKARKILIL